MQISKKISDILATIASRRSFGRAGVRWGVVPTIRHLVYMLSAPVCLGIFGCAVATPTSYACPSGAFIDVSGIELTICCLSGNEHHPPSLKGMLVTKYALLDATPSQLDEPDCFEETDFGQQGTFPVVFSPPSLLCPPLPLIRTYPFRAMSVVVSLLSAARMRRRFLFSQPPP